MTHHIPSCIFILKNESKLQMRPITQKPSVPFLRTSNTTHLTMYKYDLLNYTYASMLVTMYLLLT